MRPTRRGFLGGVLAGIGATGLSGEERATAAEAEPTGNAISVDVNGTKREFHVGDDESALDVVRDRCGLTGAKLGCGHGACGACAVLVNGTPVASCILPAAHLHQRTVRTVESFQPLHPVQRAFMAEDALQCGYCTPGFVVEAAAFVDRWRAANGDKAPLREEIAAALSGHLCRCGAYDQIYRAVASACVGEHDAADPVPARVEARDKVSGAAMYTVDKTIPGMIFARALRSPHASAVVTALDLTPATNMRGVRAAVRMLQAEGTIRYVGQEIAAVAADTDELARAAIAAIAVTYDVKTPVITVEAATAPGAPLVFDKPEQKQAPNANEGPLIGGRWRENLRTTDASVLAHPGRAERAVADAREGKGALVEGVYASHSQVHTPLEPRCAIAHWDGKRLVVHTSTQSVHMLARDIVERWDLSPGQVDVFSEHIGGAFGSKVGLAIEHLVAIRLTRECTLPVKFVLDRTDEITVGGSRPSVSVALAMATDVEGALAGLVAASTSNGGAAVGGGVGWHLRVNYGGGARHLTDYDVPTNIAPSKAFRGPGGPAAFFAYESAVDTLAHARSEDPLKLRQRWDQNAVRTRLYAKVAEVPLWRDRAAHAADKGRYRRGVGLASAGWLYLVSSVAQVRIDTGRDGILVSCACQDMGNGTRSMLADAVAAELRIAPSDVTVRLGDSRDVSAPMSAGSRTTASLAPSARLAAAQVRTALYEAGARILRGDVRRIDAGVTAEGVEYGWAQLARLLPPMTFVASRPRDPTGYFVPFAVGETNIGEALNGAVVVTEVEVDVRLGRVRALRNWSGVGCGELVSPVLAASQLTGAVIQGVSYALYEERLHDATSGQVLTHDLEHYRLIGLGDTPEIETYFDTEPWPGTLGPIGMSEVATCGQAAAIGNAVFHATGFRPMSLPIRLDRVLAGVPA